MILSYNHHLFKEKSLEPSHFIKLIEFLIRKIKTYSAPYLDSEISDWEKDMRKNMTNEIVYSDFIPIFFKNCIIS